MEEIALEMHSIPADNVAGNAGGKSQYRWTVIVISAHKMA